MTWKRTCQNNDRKSAKEGKNLYERGHVTEVEYNNILDCLKFCCVEKSSRKRESEKPRERAVSLQLFLPPGHPIISCEIKLFKMAAVSVKRSIGKIEECLSDLDKWMSLNKLKLNKDKTDLLYLYSKHSPQQSLPPIRFGQDIIHPSQSARNIGVIFDRTMIMLPHITCICKSASYHLRNISRIRKFLSAKTTEILVHAFVIQT